METVDIQVLLKQHITDQFSYLGAIQGIILGIVVLNYPKKHRISNRILSVFLFLLAFLLIAPRIMEAVDSNYIRLMYGIRALAPISIFLYIQSLYKNINWRKQYWHLIIIMLDFVVIFAVIEMKISSFGDGSTWRSSGWGAIGMVWFIFIFALYFPLIYREIQRYRTKVQLNFSSLHKLGLNWVTLLFYGSLILIVIDVLVGFFSLGFPDLYGPYHGLINTLTYTGFMYFITIKGKLTPQIYQLRLIEEKSEEPAQHKTNTLNENEELQAIATKVLQIMKEEMLFKEEGLSIKELAEKLGNQPYLVSQAINTCLEKNFFELVNGFRVEEAKKLMVDEHYNHLSLLGIGFEAGFSSKTAFNTAFKKHTGKIPSQYKKENMERVE